jgi:hypothetical protein
MRDRQDAAGSGARIGRANYMVALLSAGASAALHPRAPASDEPPNISTAAS